MANQKTNNITISFAVTACNEYVELKRLLDQLLTVAKPTDEIVIQVDETNSTLQIRELIEEYQTKTNLIKHILYPLNGKFADFKNNLKTHCSKKYIFQIDADEYLGTFLILIHELLSENLENELFYVSRINTVSNIRKDYIESMGWIVDHTNHYEGLPIINWPDVQARIFKNLKRIKWEGDVHEKIVGHKTFALINNGDIKDVEGNRRFSLIHQKTFDKQIHQNQFYNQILNSK